MDLALLLEGKMVLSEATDLLAEESRSDGEESAVARAVKSGYSLATGVDGAFGRLPEWVTAAISATEGVGEPERGLRLAAEQLLEEKKWREEFSRSLAYPLALLLTTFLVGIIMAHTVLPSLAAMSEDLGGAVPFMTQIAIAVGRALGSGWAVGVWLIAVVSLIWLGRGSSTARDLLARAPVVGAVIRLTETWRFFSTISVLLRSTLPLHMAAEYSARVVSTPAFRKAAEELAREVCRGQSIGVAARRVAWFPSRVSRVLSISPNHGSLVQSIENIASWAEQERARLLATWAKWLPMGLLAVAAVVIGLLAQAVLMPALSIDIAP
jgi:general secretion pathway protein F